MDIARNLERAERDFVEALTRQERWAQQQVYEEHYGRMMGICLRYAGSRDEALDLLHEAFIKVFQNIGRYKAGTAFGAWIRTIVVNTCIDYYRRNTRRRRRRWPTRGCSWRSAPHARPGARRRRRDGSPWRGRDDADRGS